MAQRVPRDFTADEQLILESLAPQAAVAVENAHLFESQFAALKSEREAREESSHRLAQVQRLARAEHAFALSLSSRSGYESLASDLSEALSCQVAAFDAEGELLAGSVAPPFTQLARETVQNALGKSSHSTDSEVVGTDSHSFRVTLARARGDILGGFIAIKPKPPTDSSPENPSDQETDQVILTRASSHLAALLLFQRTIEESRYRQERDLMSALTALDPLDDSRAITRSLAQLSRGTPPAEQNRAIIVLEVEQDRHPTVLRTIRSSGLLSVAASHEGHVCGIYDKERFGLKDLEAVLEPLNHAFVGGTSEFPEIARAAVAHREAAHLARSLSRLGRDREIVSRGKLGSAGMLAGAGSSNIVEAVVSEQLEPLLRYDNTHGTKLVETCEAWFNFGRSIPETAKYLFVHSNTVRQRLDRIVSLVGSEQLDGPQSFELHLALRLWRLQQPGDAPSSGSFR